MSVALPNSPQGHDLGGSPFAAPGIEYAGNQYLFVHQGAEFFVGDAGIHILKSTDAGLTWHEIASVLVTPAGTTVVPNVSYTVCQDGATAYILYTDASGAALPGSTPASFISGPLYLRTFNLATDTLGGESTTGLSVYRYTAGFDVYVDLVRRGPGDMLLTYSSLPQAISTNIWSRVSVVTFNGSGFGAPALVPGQAGIAGAFVQTCSGMDDAGILHIILNSNASGHQLLHSGFSSGGFGTTSVVDTIAFVSTTSRLASYSGSIAFVGSRDGQSKTIYHASSGTTTPAWDIHDLTSFSPVVANGVIFPELPFALAYLDGDLHLFWTRSGSVADDWDARVGLGVIQHSQASATDLATWASEDTIIGNPGPTGNKWAAAQVSVYAGPVVGLGIFAGFSGVDVSTDNPVENSQFLGIPPAGGAGPSITCGSPPGGVMGVAYSHAMPNTHTGTFSVHVTAGALPDGLTMDTAGLITGTPTLAGSFSYTATITDTAGTSTVDCTITVIPSSLGLGCASPPDGVVGEPYFHAFPVSGGAPPYTFAIISGILPPGLTLDSLNGEVSGTPTLAGHFEFQIQVSDTFGSTVGTCDITITVTDLPASDIGCGSPPGGEVGAAYSHTFPVTDIPSGATVAYSITGGALPPGLTLNTATGQVTGTPTAEGHYGFTITATIT